MSAVHAIGEEFTASNGKTYRCVKTPEREDCETCALYLTDICDNEILYCSACYRRDNNSIKYEET